MNKITKVILEHATIVYGQAITRDSKEILPHIRNRLLYDLHMVTRKHLPLNSNIHMINDYIWMRTMNDEIQCDLGSVHYTELQKETSFRRLIFEGGQNLIDIYYNYMEPQSLEICAVEDLLMISELLKTVVRYIRFEEKPSIQQMDEIILAKDRNNFICPIYSIIVSDLLDLLRSEMYTTDIESITISLAEN